MRMGRPLCWPRSQKWPYFSYPRPKSGPIFPIRNQGDTFTHTFLLAEDVDSVKQNATDEL